MLYNVYKLLKSESIKLLVIKHKEFEGGCFSWLSFSVSAETCR